MGETRSDFGPAIKQMYSDTMHQGDFSRLDELFTPGFACTNPWATVDGTKGIKDSIAAQRAALAGLEMKIEFQVVGQTGAATVYTIAGVHEKELFGHPPTGRPVSWGGVTVHRFAGDRIDRAWGFSDIHQGLDR